MLNVFFYVIGLVLWFCFLYYVNAKKSGDYSFGMLKFKLGNKKILHIHHWMYYTVLLVGTLFLVSKFNSKLKWFILGILTGGILHGLSYDDFYKIYYKDKIKNK